MGELFSLFKRRLMMEVIKYKLFDKKRVRIGDRKILFTNISDSNLLTKITVKGYREFESEVVKLIENYPWHIDRFIDTGAHIGFYSILATIFFSKDVDIIAVEPFPANVEYIRKIKRINDFDFKLIDKALDKSDDGEVTMYYPVGRNSSKLSSSASLINSFQGTDGIYNNLPCKTLTVKTITLPTAVGIDNRDTLIKLDCEGNELNILKTSSPILKRPNVDFIIEIMLNDKDKQDVYDLMKGYGYNAYLITNTGFVREDRPLTLPYLDIENKYRNYTGTVWKSHFFTKRDPHAIEEASLTLYGYYI